MIDVTFSRKQKHRFHFTLKHTSNYTRMNVRRMNRWDKNKLKFSSRTRKSNQINWSTTDLVSNYRGLGVDAAQNISIFLVKLADLNPKIETQINFERWEFQSWWIEYWPKGEINSKVDHPKWRLRSVMGTCGQGRKNFFKIALKATKARYTGRFSERIFRRNTSLVCKDKKGIVRERINGNCYV